MALLNERVNKNMERICLCSDPENCTQRVPGYRCKKDFMPKATLTSKERNIPAEVREAYREILKRAHDSTHYEDCWKDHWPCVLEHVLDEVDRLRPMAESWESYIASEEGKAASNETTQPEIFEYSEQLYDERGEPGPKKTFRCVKLSQYRFLEREIERLRTICASAYQMAGAYDAPVRFLDALALHDEYMQMTPDQISDKLLPVESPVETTTRQTGMLPALGAGYGGKIHENVLQASAADIYAKIAVAVLANMDPGKPYRVTVMDDEIMVERIKDGITDAEHDAIMDSIRESGGSGG